MSNGAEEEGILRHGKKDKIEEGHFKLGGKNHTLKKQLRG